MWGNQCHQKKGELNISIHFLINVIIFLRKDQIAQGPAGLRLLAFAAGAASLAACFMEMLHVESGSARLGNVEPSEKRFAKWKSPFFICKSPFFIGKSPFFYR